MSRIRKQLLLIILSAIGVSVQAQVPVQTNGALVIVSANGEVKHANDEAHATLMIEEQDKDKVAAASRVNQKMKSGIEIIKRADAQAMLKTRGYYTYPVYAEDQQRPGNKVRQPTSWRVGQYLEMTTKNLNDLPKTVAAAQAILALNGLYFGLSDTASKQLDEVRIAATYKNLTERIAAIAKAMGRNVTDAVLDTVDFEGSGAYAQQPEAVAPKMMRSSVSQEAEPVENPSFEPGETTLQMHVVGRVKFK